VPIGNRGTLRDLLDTSRPPRRLARFLCAVLIGIVVGAYADLFWKHPRAAPSDFWQPWAAARLLAQGKNPYELIGPGRTYEHKWPLVYPATAAVAAMPFAWASPRVADALFIGFGAAVLAWALTRRTFANPQLWVFASFAMMVSAQTVQWSPLLTAAALTPWLGFLFAVKPTIGLALLVAYPSRAAIYGAAAFGLLTIAIWPYWIPQWLANLPSITHMITPVTLWGGPLILLALLKWRRADARLLVACACVPQTPVLYEVVPLFLLVRNFREATLLVVLTGVVGKIVARTLSAEPYNAWMVANGQWMVWLVYLPCTAMVLFRPNEGLTLDWRAMIPHWSRDRRPAPDPA
jgi:hypothetical protein